MRLAVTIILLLGVAAFAAYLSVIYLFPAKSSYTPTSPPATNQSSELLPIIEVQPPQTAVPDATEIEFEKTVKIDEPFTVDVGFRDLSQLPLNISDYQAEVAKLPLIPGKLTLAFTKFGAAEKITALAERPGYRYYYVVYSLTGDPNNPSGSRISPNSPFTRGIDTAPQAVLVVGDKVSPVDNRDYEAISGFFGLSHPTHVKFDSGATRYLGGVWERPDNRLPVIAVEYTNSTGERKFIKLEY